MKMSRSLVADMVKQPSVGRMDAYLSAGMDGEITWCVRNECEYSNQLLYIQLQMDSLTNCIQN